MSVVGPRGQIEITRSGSPELDLLSADVGQLMLSRETQVISPVLVKKRVEAIFQAGIGMPREIAALIAAYAEKSVRDYFNRIREIIITQNTTVSDCMGLDESLQPQINRYIQRLQESIDDERGLLSLTTEDIVAPIPQLDLRTFGHILANCRFTTLEIRHECTENSSLSSVAAQIETFLSALFNRSSALNEDPQSSEHVSKWVTRVTLTSCPLSLAEVVEWAEKHVPLASQNQSREYTQSAPQPNGTHDFVITVKRSNS